MDIVKFKITSKTIKVEVRNSNNYVFNFNTALDIAKEDKDVLLKLSHLKIDIYCVIASPRWTDFMIPYALEIGWLAIWTGRRNQKIPTILKI